MKTAKLVFSALLLVVSTVAFGQSSYTETVGEAKFKMIFIKGLEFQMGTGLNDAIFRKVQLDNYLIAETEVTQELWVAVMGSNPSFFNDCLQCPVEMVNYDDVTAFILKLNELSNKKYRLPTEAEWEYAASGGELYQFSGSSNSVEVAWGSFDFRLGEEKTKPVKLKKSNKFGLYDMSGNVWEFCFDWYDRDYPKVSPLKNPQGPNQGTRKSMRGGSYQSINMDKIRSRSSDLPKIQRRENGFRLCISANIK